MANLIESAGFREPQPLREKETIEDKLHISQNLLQQITDPEIFQEITQDSYIAGEVPRLSPFDMDLLPQGTRLVKVPEKLQEKLAIECSEDRMRWNKPEDVLSRLAQKDNPFTPPGPGNSKVMDRLEAEGEGVTFENLKLEVPSPSEKRESRKKNDAKIDDNHNIMGRSRIPFALGAMPDIGSPLAYVLMAQSNGIAYVARDKVLSDVDKQTAVVKSVIDCLQEMPLPNNILPNEAQLQEFWTIMKKNPYAFNTEKAMASYVQELRSSWVANVGVAIEASPGGLKRAEKAYNAGARLFRIYSPEGGLEIVDQTQALRSMFNGEKDVKIVAGQIMDVATALKAEDAGCDGLMVGVAGGRQCTTSKNAGLPVNTPNVLYRLRGKVKTPIGVEGGGVGDSLMLAFALGASYVSKPGEIGLSIEGSGGKYIMQGPNGKLLTLYGGEASDSSKWWRDLLDQQGRPEYVEGEPGVAVLPNAKHSMTRNINRLRQQTAIALVFQRASSISKIQERDCSNIVRVTPEVSNLSGAYAT